MLEHKLVQGQHYLRAALELNSFSEVWKSRSSASLTSLACCCLWMPAYPVAGEAEGSLPAYGTCTHNFHAQLEKKPIFFARYLDWGMQA